MKRLILLIILFIPLAFLQAQIKVDVKGKVKDEANDRANQHTDEAIDKAFDKAEEGVISVFKKKDKEDQDQEDADEEKEEKQSGKKSSSSKNNEDTEQSKSTEKKEQPQLVWSKYDFIPGDKVFFEDNQVNEQNGEFPSRWDLYEGVAENAVFGNASVIYFKEPSTCIIPFVKNAVKDYLPDVFTIEFDAWFEVDEYCSYHIYFYDQKNQSESIITLDALEIAANQAILHGISSGFYPGTDENDISSGFWRHIAISFNIRALKVYLDDTRVINIPNLGINPEGFTICCDNMNTSGAEGKNRFIKNIRFAEGGVKLYDKLMQDGKIVSNGIKFDVGKATIKPESMGVINSICQLMKEHSELKFSVEGHTDSDGDVASNQTLSEKRARAVADQLISMGIDPSRLQSKGWGESKPLSDNSTAEGKANNRRVEFIKI
jgi:outer membrane protein OmpA-like peptidoglycan-associated protein